MQNSQQFANGFKKKNDQHGPRELVNNLQYHMDQSDNFFEGGIVPLQ